MAVLLRPKRWAGKPLVGAVDPSHPLAVGLRTCFLFGAAAGLPHDLGGSYGSAFDGTPTWAQTPGGPGLATASGSGVHSLDTSYNLAAGNFTVRVVHMPTSLSTFAALYEKTNGAAREASFFIGSSGQLSFWQISGTSLSASPAGLAMTVGKVWDVVFVRRLPGQLSVFLNGVPLGDATAGAATGTAAQAGSRVTLGPNASGGGQAYNGTYISSQTWTRALNAAEIAQLYVDPYAFMLPQAPRRTLWAVPASSTVTATASSVLPSVTQTATGTVTQPTYTATTASTLPSLTQAAAGTVTKPTYTATAASVLPSLTQTATGTVTQPVYTATATSTLPALIQTATGTSTPPTFTAVAASTLPSLTQHAAGSVTAPTYTATAASVLPSVTQQATGTSTGIVVPNIRGYSSSSIAALSSSTTSLTPVGSSTSSLSTAGASTASVG